MDSFGKQRLQDFNVDPNYINVNHGSYGLAPKLVLQHQRELQQRCDFNTEKWFRIDAEKLLADTRDFVSHKINCATENVYLVNNATDAINSLAKSLTWQQGDIVLLPNTAYSSIRKTFYWLRQKFNITVLDIELTIEDMQSQEAFQMKVENFVNSYPKKIKLAVFDHIISVPGFICPIESLVEFFREKKITMFVDGAHAINQVNIDIGELQPDAYFSNFHKWGYAPKSAAFLYLSDAYLHIVKPAITGNFYGEGPARQYFWCGTRDITAFLSVEKGIEYSESFGPNAVHNHNHSLALQAASKVAQIWGTKQLTPDERGVGYLVNVEVPSDDLQLCGAIAYEMMDSDNCFPIFFKFDGKVFVRLSAQIYNQISDYEFMASKFLSHLERENAKKGIN